MKKIILAVALLAGLSFATCESGRFYSMLNGQWCNTVSSGQTCSSSCDASSRCCDLSCSGEYCFSEVKSSGGYYYTNLDYDATTVSDGTLRQLCANQIPFYGSSVQALYTTRCTSKAEADSAYCEANPNADGCFTPKDTTTYGCRDEIEITNGGAVTYHVVYKFTGKTTQGGGAEWTNYEEKENAPMSCAEVGYCNYGQNQCTGDLNGWFGDDSGSSSSSSSFDWGSSSSVSCKQTGQFGNNCYFECDNGAVGFCQGNDFNCDVVSDCEWQMQSSASDSPNSSASGQSASSENPDLQAIIENQNTQIEQLNYNNDRLDSIKGRLGLLNGKTDASNALLSQIANNLGKIDNKTSIITNNTLNRGETIDYTDALNALGDSLGGIGSRLDKMLSGDSASLDSFSFDIGIDSLLDTGYTTYGDSLEGAYNSFADTYRGLVSDTGAIGRYTDSLAQLQKKFNFSPLGGSGTGCPSFLTKTYEINFIGNAKAVFDLNKLGLCSPIIGNRTPWDLARALLRIIVAVSCMWFLFKCATSSGDNE